MLLNQKKTRSQSLQVEHIPFNSRDGEVAVWALKSGKQGKGIGVADATDAVSQLYWRPDDRALAALDAQGCITVWRI